MRVSIFFDGKYFYAGLKAKGPVSVDFVKLAQWLVGQVGGTRMWGAYYYTGIETEESSVGNRQTLLTKLLADLEVVPGYFVRRFPRKRSTARCTNCGGETKFTEEKEVDTTLAIDMVRLAGVNGFDVAILISGDADHAATVEAVQSLGKQVFVATWASDGLSYRLRKAVYDCIDLCHGIKAFEIDVSEGLRAFVVELKKAEEKFAHGYVGLKRFLDTWEGSNMTGDLVVRRHLLNYLVRTGEVAVYQAPDGNMALRCAGDERERAALFAAANDLGTTKIKID